MSAVMGERTTIRMKGELLSAAKRRAAEQNRTLTEFIEDAVRAAIAHPKATKRAEIVISKEVGGPLPGIDLIRTGALIGMLDDEKWFELQARLQEEAKLEAEGKEPQGAK